MEIIKARRGNASEVALAPETDERDDDEGDFLMDDELRSATWLLRQWELSFGHLFTALQRVFTMWQAVNTLLSVTLQTKSANAMFPTRQLHRGQCQESQYCQVVPATPCQAKENFEVAKTRTLPTEG